MTLRIGAHPSNLTMTALAYEPSLQDALRAVDAGVEFINFDTGKAAADALDRGDINVIGTGSTRALASQASDVAITYLAASRPRRSGAAILVREASDIADVKDLAGKRIGFIEGSFHTYFLAAALDAAGLAYAAAAPVNWPVKDSLRALHDGEIDAWVASAPYLTPALEAGGLRALIGCDAVIPNRSVFWIRSEVQQRGRAVVETIARSFADTERWIAADHDRAGRLFAGIIGGVSPQAWSQSLAAREWGLVPVEAEVLGEQQAEADLLARQGLLPKAITLTDAALPYGIELPA